MISHLLFANDSFLFFRANERETHTLKSILHTYGEATGQKINFLKSEVCFSRNVGEDVENSIATDLVVTIALGTGKYLGLPSIVGRGKKAMFSFIKCWLWKKINSWNAKNLSMAGKEVLIKSATQAIPSYCMIVFLIPHSLCYELLFGGAKNFSLSK